MKQKIISWFNTQKAKIIKHPFACLMIMVYLAVFAVVIATSCVEVACRIAYETLDIANADTYLFYAVGKGMANGLSPYSGMYENKPPLIFVLSSVSYTLTGGFRLMNYLHALALVVVIATSVAFAIMFLRKQKVSFLTKVCLFVFMVAFSFTVVIFSQSYSSEMQVETFGSACIILSFLFTFLIAPTDKLNDYKVVLSGIFMGLGVMFKEPFVIVWLAGALLFSNSKSDYFKKLLIPFIYGSLTCFVVLVLSSSFVPYFTIYLPNMFGNHINNFGSPFLRMTFLDLSVKQMFLASKTLPFVVAIMLVTAGGYGWVTVTARDKADELMLKALSALKPLLLIFFITFAVGLGGHFFNHHYVFWTPFFIALAFAFVSFVCHLDGLYNKQNACQECAETADIIEQEEQKQPSEQVRTEQINQVEQVEQVEKVACKPKLTFGVVVQKSVMQAFAILLIFANVLGFILNDYTLQFDNWYVQETPLTYEKAEYIDNVLNALEEENYLWIGFNGNYPYAFTEHAPLGPTFVQDPNNFADESNFFVKKFRSSLQTANVLVLCSTDLELGVITDETNDYIKEHFTDFPPFQVFQLTMEKPQCFDYIIMYRRAKFW